jgi:hypothetical protein
VAELDSSVRFCPACGQALAVGMSYLQEFWVATETIYYCWCSSCSWRGEIKAVARVIGVEPAEDDQSFSDLHELETIYRNS